MIHEERFRLIHYCFLAVRVHCSETSATPERILGLLGFFLCSAQQSFSSELHRRLLANQCPDDSVGYDTGISIVPS